MATANYLAPGMNSQTAAFREKSWFLKLQGTMTCPVPQNPLIFPMPHSKQGQGASCWELSNGLPHPHSSRDNSCRSYPPALPKQEDKPWAAPSPNAPKKLPSNSPFSSVISVTQVLTLMVSPRAWPISSSREQLLFPVQKAELHDPSQAKSGPTMSSDRSETTTGKEEVE